MIKIDNGICPFYKFLNLSSQRGILHFVSSGAKTIGFSEGESSEIVCANRIALAAAVGFKPNSLITGHQVHSTNIAVVTEIDVGRGALDRESRLPDTDALVTNREGICLMVLSADCVPILLYDPVHRVIAAIHAGWRGTAAEIVAKTIRVMQTKFNCSPEHILAAIGPSIGQCCFEVGEEVAETFNTLFPKQKGIVETGKSLGKYQVDLWAANQRELIKAGLTPPHIEVAGECSVCSPEKFFSYRRNGTDAGRFGAGIMMNAQ
ncbi:MAG: peptidoglycan editing factor PgeF [Odoribacter sp.]